MIRKYIRITIYAIAALLAFVLTIMVIEYKKLSEEYDIAVGNEKALLQDNTSLRKNIGVLQLSVDQLSYFNDSILTKLDNVRRELRIKDKDLRHLQYIQSTMTKKDSIIFKRDTIFVKDLHIDTTMYSKWYKLHLKLDYPNSVVVNPHITSEQYVVIHAAKETIKPPKKCAIARWFQKKHTVIRVDIKEENPYIKLEKSKFVKILEK